MANPSGYDYPAFRAAIADRDGWSCHVHRILVARREAVIERWRTEASDVSVDHCAGWVPTGLLRCDGELDGHHAALSKSWLKSEFGRLEFPRIIPDLGSMLTAPGAWEAEQSPEGATYVQYRWESFADILNDPRNGIIACRRHHDLIEGPTEAVKLRRADLPPCAEEFAAELGTKAVARLERNFELRPSVGERTGG